MLRKEAGVHTEKERADKFRQTRSKLGTEKDNTGGEVTVTRSLRIRKDIKV
jgi:hypothetical protein